MSQERRLGHEEVSLEGAQTGYQLLVSEEQAQKRPIGVGICVVDDFVEPMYTTLGICARKVA